MKKNSKISPLKHPPCLSGFNTQPQYDSCAILYLYFFFTRLLLSVPDRQQGTQEQLHLYLLPVWYAGHPAQHVTGAVGTDLGRAML